MKKLSVLLGALLFSASPAVAEDFVYLRCESNRFITVKDLKSNQIVKREEKTVIQHLKLDLLNSRIMGSLGGEWEEIEIVNGYVVEDKKEIVNGNTVIQKASMQFDPTGQIVADVLIRRDSLSELESGKIRGICEGSDESAFEKALKKSQS
tara:strand:- start:59 stop:511 length:453 start_codon:yes stop_codon:yes gene_type:complete